MVCNALGDTVPVLQTIFSPLAQAKNLVGGQQLLVHLRKYPEEILEGLRIITETTSRFIEAVCHMNVAGIFYAVQHASYQLLSKEEYKKFGRGDDLQLLEVSAGKWLNMLHLHGEDIIFSEFVDYPVQVINWHDRETHPGLAEAKQLYKGVVCGGLQRTVTMELGTPEQVRAETRDAILATENQRFILGTGCVLPITTPQTNILTAIQSCSA
jgi:uroporphyrinogen decarboxylase